MKVKDTIKMLQETLAKLQELDPEKEMAGHLIRPDGGYVGDVDGDIYKMDVAVQTDGVVLDIYHK